ncbi:MAG: ArsR family transcriptional regulator [Deltaproteobacteria bacterium]|nr:ArsR family transcriptional regulator [Deltaproteobacteria bacterium]
MKVKRVKIGVRPPGTIFNEAAEVISQIETGRRVRTQGEWLYFSNVREMGKVLTPKRLELLKLIREQRPESIRSVAELAGRNVKNVSEDLELLTSLGLVEMETHGGPGKKKAPRVSYETLTVEVHL